MRIPCLRPSILIAMGFSAVGLAQEPLDFSHQIAPLLQQRCGRCHLDGNREGDVEFNTREELLRAEIVELADPPHSELLLRVRSPDKELRMPPEGDPLTAAEIELLSRWITDGATWEEGFTFRRTRVRRPMQLPEVAENADPDGQSSLDPIVDRYFAQHGVSKNPRVGDRAFYRRVSLDLVGLLPDPTALEAFVADTAPDKREKLVEQLLADDVAYADHWLTFWNDLLRNDYAGTGYIDGGREAITAWLYAALRENRPYDAMVRQLLTPAPEASGFAKGIRWRGRINASQIPELQFAQNVGQVFLGVNLKCASCHDSFIDDWKLTDAYGLAAVVAEQPLELHRCDVPQGQFATASFLFPELGQIDPAADRTARLASLAQLVTQPSNGRFARTIVNRLWQRMMGRALVEPVDTMDAPAWDEELLDFLAADLVAHGYDLRHTLQAIANSAAYQTESMSPPAPGEDFVFRGPLPHRLTAEQWLDAVWTLTGQFPAQPAADFGERNGHSIRAGLVVASRLMTVLGRPNREQVVTTRPNELTTLDALELSNGEELAAMLQTGGQSLQQHFADQPADESVRRVYIAALSRLPDDGELEVARAYLGSDMSDEGWADLLWALVVSPEFCFVR